MSSHRAGGRTLVGVLLLLFITEASGVSLAFQIQVGPPGTRAAGHGLESGAFQKPHPM